jgi:hypothetical protein
MPDWLSKFALWCANNLLWDIFKGIVVSVIGTSVIWFWKNYVGKPVPTGKQVAFWCVGIIGGTFLLAALQGINGYPNKDKEDALQIAVSNYNYNAWKLTNPDFNCEIIASIFGGLDADTQEHTIVVLIIRLVNNGAPSVALDWKLRAKILSGEIVDANLLSSAIRLTDTNAPKGLTECSPEKNIPGLFSEDPMASGAAKKGWAGFAFDKAEAAEITRLGVVFTLIFADRTGRIYEESITNQSYNIRYYAPKKN